MKDWWEFRSPFWLTARIDGILHRLRGHNIRWFYKPDEICAGDILCERCPDTEDHGDLLLWCRAHDPWWIVECNDTDWRGRYIWQFWKKLN